MMDAIINFIMDAVGQRPVEIVAVLLGLINISLLIRRSIWNFPVGMVMVTLYGYIFLQEKLYSGAILQIFFFTMQIYGWLYWAKGLRANEANGDIEGTDGQQNNHQISREINNRNKQPSQNKPALEKIRVARLSPDEYIYYLAFAVLGVLGVGGAMMRWTDASLPFPDAMIAVFSVIAQFMLARRLLENWLVWIFVDMIAIGVYLYQELYPTAFLYGVFLVMAIIGYRRWCLHEETG